MAIGFRFERGELGDDPGDLGVAERLDHRAEGIDPLRHFDDMRDRGTIGAGFCWRSG